jgi:hypothetical protein
MNTTQKLNSSQILKDVISLCHVIINSCERDQLDEVIHQADQLRKWLNQINEKDIMGFGKQEAIEIIDILELINQANRIVVSTGFSMIFR